MRRKLIKWALIGMIGMIVAFVVGSMFISPHWEVSRSLVLAAKPEEIHPYVDGLRHWARWNPWERNDPTMRMTYGSAESGVGASRSWTSEQSGNGTQTITASDPATGVSIQIEIDGWAHLSFRLERLPR